MRNFWNKIKNLRLWAILGEACRKVGAFFVRVGKAVAVGLSKAAKAVVTAARCAIGWCALHWRAVAVGAAAVVFAVGVFLALFLTLPVKTVEVEGEVLLLQGEEYTSGLNIKATTKAGLVHREEVLPKMLSGLDPDVTGAQQVTVSYGKWRVSATVKVIPVSEVALRVREGTLPSDYEPNDPFPKSGVFDLYYDGELIRSAPITRASAPGFSSLLSGNYEIFLNYRTGLSIPYSYRVLEIIESITPTGILYAPQGAALSKNNAVGNLRFLVKYKDGTEEYVMIYDDRILVQDDVLELRDGDYQGNVKLSYKGVEVVCPVTAYKGDLLAPRLVKLHLDKTVYAVGEDFDYSKAYLEVEYERFGGTPVLLRSTESTIFLMERQGDPENYTLAPITDGSAPISFDTARSYDVVAQYMGVESALVTLRVISEEDATRVTGISTTWRGRKEGPPLKGQELEFDDAELTVEYGFGYRAETVPLTAEMVTGYDKTTPGDQDVTIAFDDFFKVITLRVGDPDSNEVTRIIAVVAWNDPTYYSSDELVVSDTAYLEVEIGYGGSPNQKIYLKDNDDVTITGFTPHVLEEQILTIKYAGFEIVFEHFVVIDDREKEMRYITAPSAIYIDVGGALDYAEITCSLGYNTGDKDDVLLADIVKDGATVWLPDYFDINVPGTYDMRISYKGFDSDWITIYVEGEPAVTATGIRLDTQNATTTYNVGDALDITGMKLYLVYSNSHEEDVTAYFSESSITGFSTAQAGEFTATVSYLSAEGAFVTGFDYTVV